MEVEELSVDNILGPSDIETLFTDNEETQEESTEETKETEDSTEKEKQETTEVNTETLFEETPESVGSEEDDKKVGDTNSEEDLDNSPNNGFYSSLAKSLKEDGILPDLEDDTANSIKSPEDFAEALEHQLQSRFDERQKRIDAALLADIEVSEIRKFENTIDYLDSLEETSITDEGENGEKLRKQLIFQDYINRGYSQERANREVKKSFDAGSDIEDAKEALTSNKEFFKGQYNGLIREALEEKKQEDQERKNQAEKLKKSILEDSKFFGEVTVDKTTRKKIYENISKPVYKDPETGEFYTEIQKYEKDNRTDFLKNVSLLYTLTDGFKNIDKLVNGRVKKEVKKGLRELEHTLNNTARTSDGNLRFSSGVSDDSESLITKGWSLDV